MALLAWIDQNPSDIREPPGPASSRGKSSSAGFCHPAWPGEFIWYTIRNRQNSRPSLTVSAKVATRRADPAIEGSPCCRFGTTKRDRIGTGVGRGSRRGAPCGRPAGLTAGEGAALVAAPSAPESVYAQRGGSPLQACALRPVTECNCAAMRRGGEQQEVNDQSIG